jgi:opacity protein-like surface antigen
MTFYRATQVMLRYGFDWGLSMGVSVENPNVNAEYNEFVGVDVQRVPNVPVFIQYDLMGNSNNHIRLGGIMRDIYYTDKITGGNSDIVGWGVQASLLATMAGFQLKGQFTIGEGIGSLVNNISNIGVDIVPDPESPGKAMLLRSESWYAGLQYNFTKNFMVSAAYSQTALHSKNGYAGYNPNASRKGQYLVANAIYNLTDNLQIGVEYLHGWRTNFDETVSNANRVNLSARYDF